MVIHVAATGRNAEVATECGVGGATGREISAAIRTARAQPARKNAIRLLDVFLVGTLGGSTGNRISFWHFGH